MIVSKSINMAKMLDIPIYGVVENMSYTVCPHCGEKIKIFSNDGTEAFLKENNIELLGELPAYSELSLIGDKGLEVKNEDIIAQFKNITDKILN